MDKIGEKVNELEKILSGCGRAAIAFSGGVDSAYLLWKSILVLGREQVLAVTIRSGLEDSGEIEAAAELAQSLQVEHVLADCDILADPLFRSNPPRRCYHCKKLMFKALQALARDRGIPVVLDGSNADDPADHRPGLEALREMGVRSPLLEAALSKAEIRQLARLAGLPVWNKPSQACLASRFPYGEEISARKLKAVSGAEKYLREIGVCGDLRVRAHGNLARIEATGVDADLIWAKRAAVSGKLRELGFLYITCDLCGFQSGSMNRPIETDP